MKTEQWLKEATKKLKVAGIGSARLDCLILLEDCLKKDRSWLLARPETPLQGQSLQELDKLVERRVEHEPLAYIRGFTEFYGRKFRVNKRVLEPRPESETMIGLLKNVAYSVKHTAYSKLTIADIGTGSGALGITAALEIPKVKVDLYDIDASCLAVARHNCALHELHLHCYKRDLLNRPARSYGVLLANLPYVPNHWKINEAAAMEPRIAIFGGKDGLDVYRRFFDQIKKLSWQPKYVFTESLPPQHKELAQIAASGGFIQEMEEDFIQVFTTK